MHSGGYDPLGDAIDLAHRYGAWVHVDGAFGLWAAASPRLRELTAGMVRADSWATDAHKTLNVPYDCGLAIVADTDAMYAAMGMHAAYLIQDERPDPFSSVPEFSRRARGFTVWAALRSLGRQGVADMVEGFCARARQFADGLQAMDDVRVLNDVVFTQVCATFGSDEVTREVSRRLLAGRHRLDDDLDLARPGRAADLGLQLAHHRGRRRAHPGCGRPDPRRGQGRNDHRPGVT